MHVAEDDLLEEGITHNEVSFTCTADESPSRFSDPFGVYARTARKKLLINHRSA